MDEQLRRRSVGAPAARSLLLTVLGEYVLPRPGGVWQETLVAALVSLGYREQAARQALSRSVGDPEQLVADAWDLTRVREQYAAFIDDFSRVRATTPEACFRQQTLLVHAWRKFPFLDPDLPAGLLPAGWPRERAQALFADRHRR